MSAAKSERVDAGEPEYDFWAIIDEELARMSLSLREVVMLCDLGGQSHAQAAESLGLAKGTITKRLARAREELAARLKRRGITLGLGALSSTIATQATAAVPATLLLETATRAVAFSTGSVGGSTAAQTLAEGVMRSIKFSVLRIGESTSVVNLSPRHCDLLEIVGRGWHCSDNVLNEARPVAGWICRQLSYRWQCQFSGRCK